MEIKETHIPVLIRQGQEQKAISLLYKKVFPNVRKYIVANRGSKEDALDVFQDAMVVFYDKVMKDSFDPLKYNVYGFVYKLSINRWLNKIRDDQKLEFTDDLSRHDTETMFMESLIPPEEENLLRSLFAGIGEKCIELLSYTIFYNMLLEDVMHRMGFSSLSAVKMQQMRCKQKLMEEIEKRPSLVDRIKGL